MKRSNYGLLGLALLPAALALGAALRAPDIHAEWVK